MTDHVDALLDALSDEKARADRAEIERAVVELAALHLVEALAKTSFTPTDALADAIDELELVLRPS